MDIRAIFKEISEQLLSEFRKTAGISHQAGKGTLREDALAEFLRAHLPTRYAVGRGEVITSENCVSNQLDIVIYDPSHCPVLIRSSSHAVYPVESVYGVISVKSRLTAGELRDAYSNIRSLKSIAPQRAFQHPVGPGHMIGMAAPVPVAGVVAYASGRTLEAIAAQAKVLDSELKDIHERPDFIAVLGEGTVGSREASRGPFNTYKVSSDPDARTFLRKAGRHTLLRLYMQLLRELNSLVLCPLDLQDYENMPKLVGPYRVRRHDHFIGEPPWASSQPKVLRVSESGIRAIVAGAVSTTRRANFLHTFGLIPEGVGEETLNASIYEYNPENKAPINLEGLKRDASGRVWSSGFIPTFIEIDKKIYCIDLASLQSAWFEENTDLTSDELLSL